MKKQFYIPDPYIIPTKDQQTDADKMMNSPEKQDSCEHILDMEKMVDVNSSNNSNGWISVKERLPNLEKTSRSLRRESSCILLTSYGNVYAAHLCEDWNDRSLFIFEACTCNCRAFDMDTDEWKLDQVTHWMPMPKPPEE
jgi:hypothetical protein